MVLNDAEIRTACQALPPLIDDHDAAHVSNCTYSFRIGRIFEPDSGAELVFSARPGVGEIPHVKSLGPNETCLVVTHERVNIPPGVVMSYTPLNSLAQQGLMMLNASVVEPGYRGPLSCVLVNLSSRRVELAPGDRVSKAVFLKLTDVPAKLEAKVISESDYLRNIARTASRYHRSFLDIGSVVDKAREAGTAAAKKAVVFGGLVVVFLLFFAQLEPLFTKWLREKTGVVSASTLLEMQARLVDSQKRLAEQETKLKELEAKMAASKGSDANRPR